MSWSKNGPLWLVLGSGVLLLGLIVFAIATHEEPGLQKACIWEPQRVATYVEEACAGRPMVELKWAPSIPVLRVRPDLSADDFQREALRGAVKNVNEQLGFDALQYGEQFFEHPLEDFEVIVFFNTPPSANVPHEGGTTTHYFNEQGQVTSSVVYVYNTPLADALGAVLAHELGHVLGLAHDDSSTSVMHSPPPLRWYFSDSDVKLLRKLRGF